MECKVTLTSFCAVETLGLRINNIKVSSIFSWTSISTQLAQCSVISCLVARILSRWCVMMLSLSNKAYFKHVMTGIVKVGYKQWFCNVCIADLLSSIKVYLESIYTKSVISIYLGLGMPCGGYYSLVRRTLVFTAVHFIFACFFHCGTNWNEQWRDFILTFMQWLRREKPSELKKTVKLVVFFENAKISMLRIVVWIASKWYNWWNRIVKRLQIRISSTLYCCSKNVLLK